MMTIKTDGIEEVGAMLAKLGDKAQDVASGALYDGAGIVADALRHAVGSIVTEEFNYIAHPEMTGTMRYPSPAEKAAVFGKTGISSFRKTAEDVNALIGVSGAAGYADIGGKRKPILLIARAIASGTSFMHKQPVFRMAKNAAQGPAKRAIADKAERMFKEIIGG